MARPKLPIAQRKVLNMTVRMRLDLDAGLAAVASLRGTTKSGLVSQYAAEQIRLEQERDRPRFDAAVQDIRFQKRLLPAVKFCSNMGELRKPHSAFFKTTATRSSNNSSATRRASRARKSGLIINLRKGMKLFP